MNICLTLDTCKNTFLFHYGFFSTLMWVFSPHRKCCFFFFAVKSSKLLSREWFYIKHTQTIILFFKAVSAYLHINISSVHPPSSLSKPSEPHNSPPPGTVYFAPRAQSYSSDLPHVYLPVASIETLIHPSGLTGAVPLGDAHLSPLMRAPSLMKGTVGGLGATERKRERREYNGGMQGPDSFPYDGLWIGDYKTQKQNDFCCCIIGLLRMTWRSLI